MLITDRINYARLAQAQTFYKGRGYTNVDTPWLVNPPAVRATLPMSTPLWETTHGVFVNSGEQSFIQKMLDGEMEAGEYQTTTPCLLSPTEHESKYFFGLDQKHPYYMMIELISYDPADIKVAYEKMLNDATACFFEVSDMESFDAIQSEEGVDVSFRGVVLGSYGVRKMGDKMWVYGTGLVEPRFTLAMHQLSLDMLAAEGKAPPTEPTEVVIGDTPVQPSEELD